MGTPPRSPRAGRGRSPGLAVSAATGWVPRRRRPRTRAGRAQRGRELELELELVQRARARLPTARWAPGPPARPAPLKGCPRLRGRPWCSCRSRRRRWSFGLRDLEWSGCPSPRGSCRGRRRPHPLRWPPPRRPARSRPRDPPPGAAVDRRNRPQGQAGAAPAGRAGAAPAGRACVWVRRARFGEGITAGAAQRPGAWRIARPAVLLVSACQRVPARPWPLVSNRRPATTMNMWPPLA